MSKRRIIMSEYDNTLLCEHDEVSGKIINRLLRVQNRASTMMIKARKWEQVSPILGSLWADELRNGTVKTILLPSLSTRHSLLSHKTIVLHTVNI